VLATSLLLTSALDGWDHLSPRVHSARPVRSLWLSTVGVASEAEIPNLITILKGLRSPDIPNFNPVELR